MKALRTIWSRIRSLTQPRAVKRDIDEELRFHLEQRVAQNIANGMTTQDAERDAKKRFGNVQTVREQCRESRGANFGETLFQDIRFGLRMLGKSPGFTTIAVLILAIGIGATSSVFSLIQSVLLTPPPYSHPEQVMLLRTRKRDGQPWTATTGQWTGWQNESKSFDVVAGYDWTFDYLLLPDRGEPVAGLEVTADYFNVIGIQPLLGRTFLESETTTNPQDATFVILGYDLWQKRFHGDTGILGQKVRLSRHEPLTIVGVMPPAVRFLPSFGEEENPTYNANARVDYWLPARPDKANPISGSGNGPWSVVARLRSGITVAAAQAELNVIAARQVQSDRHYEGLVVRVQPLIEFLNHEGRRLLWPLFGAVVLVFLIACGNVAGLLLVRGLQRQKEYAMRSALGAQRYRVFRQAMVESLVLALPAGVLGAALAIITVQVFKAIGGFAIPRLDGVTLGLPVMVFCFAAMIAAAAFAGLLPALRAAQLDPLQTIKATGPTSSTARAERRLLAGVVVAQTSFTVALLMGAGLLIRTANNLARMRPGFETENILTMRVMTDFTQYLTTDKNGFVFDSFHPRALERISALPGVTASAFVLGLPLTGNSWITEATVEGQPEHATVAEKSAVKLLSVTPDYFNAVGLRIVAGRGFRPDENVSRWKVWAEPAPGEPPAVCMINQAAADKYFPNSDPIGRHLYTFPWPKRPKEIIGIVANARTQSLTEKPAPEIYLSFLQAPMFAKHLVVRTSVDPISLASVLQRELHAIDPTVAVGDIKSFARVRADSVAGQTFAMRLLVGFSLVGSLLALVGIYGVLSLSVGSRRREMAIRIAMGAQRRSVLGLVLSGGLKLIFIGLLAGTGVALALTRTLKAFLFGIEPTDPLTFAAVAVLFTAVALLACYLPARRAAETDPMTALRCE
jgi:putative ABC transport system permease protein